LIVGLSVAAMVPSLALAQESCEQRAQNRAVGTAVGAIAGALLGNSVSGHDRTAGTVAGALGGGIVGNQLAKGPRDCQHAYGWYDDDGRWHGNGVAPAQAYGYYDRSGEWVEGPPRGYYDGRGQWVPAPPVAYDDELREWTGYPQFAGIESHIRREIDEGVRDDLIERDDARDLLAQLADIRRDEVREFRVHGWGLPLDDEYRLRRRLETLDQTVDGIRDEP
jgi:hypothetical protein